MKASQAFKVGKNKIAYVGSNFSEWFGEASLSKSGEVLGIQILPRYMNDAEIQQELNVKECSLADVLKTLTSETLLTNGNANIFYVKDINGVLRTVFVNWDGDGWVVDANALDDYQWYVGRRVFSRNSSIPESLADALEPGTFDPSTIKLTLDVAGVKYEAQFKKVI